MALLNRKSYSRNGVIEFRRRRKTLSWLNLQFDVGADVERPYSNKPTAANPIKLSSTENNRKLENSAMDVSKMMARIADMRAGKIHIVNPAMLSVTMTNRLYVVAMFRSDSPS